MKKLFTLLTLLLCAVVGVKAASVYEWTHNGVFKTLKVTAEKGGGAASQYTGYTISYVAADGNKYTCSTAVKMESATTLTFTTSAKSTITVGVVLKDGNSYTSSKATLKLDDSTVASALTADANGAKTEDAVYAVFTDVAAGTHVIKRNSSELGVCYIRVEETGAVLTQLEAPTITIDSSNGEVTIGAVANASKITYTIDGSNPTAESTEYTVPFIVEDGVTVKAIAIGDDVSYSNSTIASAIALLDNVVVANPVIKQYNGSVAISCETSNTTIEYSLDGTNYSDYARSFTLSEDATVYARAKRGEKVSDVVSVAVATISKGAATKTLWLAHNMFDNNSSNSMTGKTGTDAEGFALAITGNSTKTWSYGNADITVGGNTLQTIKLSNGAENTLSLPDGLKATRITFYSVINSAEARTSYWKSFKSTNVPTVIEMGAWNSVTDRLTNPDVRVFPLDGDETSVTFCNTGEQLLFVIAIDVIEEATVVVGNAGWATTVTAKALDFSGVTGLTAYTAKLTDNKVTLSEAGEVPAGTALVLKGDEGTYSVPVIASAAAVEDNDLLGSATAATTMDANNTYYGLKVNGEGKAQFAKVTGESIPAGKAYLMVAGASARSFFDIDEDVTTAINSVAEQQANGEVYNLQGQRVKAATKGLYIVNGKKVVIK